MKNKIQTLTVTDSGTVPVKENAFLTLNKWDWLKALLIAILTPVVDYLIVAIQEQGFGAIDWNRVWVTGVSAALVYLVKNFLSPSVVTIEKRNL